jgi:hypothetical protein
MRFRSFLGDTALNLGMKKPKQTYSHIKALMGRAYDEAYLAKFGSFYFPFDIVNHTRGVFGLKYDVEGDKDDLVFQPEEIYSQILQEAKQVPLRPLNAIRHTPSIRNAFNDGADGRGPREWRDQGLRHHRPVVLHPG